MRILGIDIGSTTIKAVEIETSFSRYEIVDYYEKKIQATDETPIWTIQALINSLPKSPQRIAIAVPSRKTTFRTLDVPTRDKKAVLAAVQFELEDELPFSIDKAHFAYSVVSSGAPPVKVFVQTTMRESIEEQLQMLFAAGVDPELLTSESWAIRGLHQKLAPDLPTDENYLLVDCGESRTVFHALYNGNPVVNREVVWGGKNLTQALAQKYGMSPQQAEQSKLDHGFILTQDQRAGATTEQIELSDTLYQPFLDLIWEVRQAEFAFKSATGQKLTKIYVTGGASLLPGFARTIEEAIGTPVRPFRALSQIAGTGVTYSEQTDATHSLALALALTFVSSERGQTLNFRRGDLVKRQRAVQIEASELKYPLLMGGLFFLCAMLSLGVQTYVYKGRVDEANKRLEKNIKAFFGQISPAQVKSYQNSATLLRTKIKEEKTKQENFARLAEPNVHSPLQYLNRLSQSVSKSITVDLVKYQVGSASDVPFDPADPGNAELVFWVENAGQAKQLSDLLKAQYPDLTLTNPEEVKTPDGKRMKITAQGKRKGEST